MPQIKTETYRTMSVRTETRAIITVDDIRRAFGIPAGAEITIGIPGGGDWSNTDLPLSEAEGGGVLARWTEVKESGEE